MRISLDALPETSAAYALFDENGLCLYVGSSVRLRTRIFSHPLRGKFDSCRWVTCPPAKLEAVEQGLYLAAGPTLNKRRIRRADYSFCPTRANVFYYATARPYSRPAVTSGIVSCPQLEAARRKAS
jgi:hypothetical protein